MMQICQIPVVVCFAMIINNNITFYFRLLYSFVVVDFQIRRRKNDELAKRGNGGDI
jgi:hypothetical protein